MGKKTGVLLSFLLVFVTISPFISGCYDRIELEEMAFIVSLGLDKGPGDTIDVTARVAVPRKLTGGEGGGGGGGDEAVGGSKAITIRAHTVEEALNLLNTNVERRVSLIHLSMVVFGEDLARQGIMPYIRPLTRYREFRRTVFIQMVKGTAREAFDANKPILEKTVTRFTEDISDVSRHTGLSASVKLHDFLIALAAKDEDAYMGVFAVNEAVKKQLEEEKAKGKGDKGGQEGKGEETGGKGAKEEAGGGIKITGKEPSFEPGKVKRQGGNPLEFLGTAVFRGDSLVTILDGIDTRMMLALRGDLQRTQMDFENPYAKGTHVAVEIKPSRSPQYEISPFVEPAKIHIKLNLEGDLIANMASTDFMDEAHVLRLEQYIGGRIQEKCKDLLNTLFHKYQSDPIALIKSVRHQFLTYEDFKAYNWRERLKTANIAVDVDFKLRRIGVQLSPPIPG